MDLYHFSNTKKGEVPQFGTIQIVLAADSEQIAVSHIFEHFSGVQGIEPYCITRIGRADPSYEKPTVIMCVHHE